MNNFWSAIGLRSVHNNKFTRFDWSTIISFGGRVSADTFIYMVIDVPCNNQANPTEFYDYSLHYYGTSGHGTSHVCILRMTQI